jgi:hypothetical protein
VLPYNSPELRDAVTAQPKRNTDSSHMLSDRIENCLADLICAEIELH